MVKRVQVGGFYRVKIRGLFEVDRRAARHDGILQDGDIVRVVNPPGGRKSGRLRHVMNEAGEVTFCDIAFLEPYPYFSR